jgi:hypothetical protein
VHRWGDAGSGEKIQCLVDNHAEYYFSGTLLVTVLSNAKNSALYARRLAAAKIATTRAGCAINIIASHAENNDDFACAECLRDIVLDTQRIRDSRPPQKFYDPNIPAAHRHAANGIKCLQRIVQILNKIKWLRFHAGALPHLHAESTQRA